MPFHLVHKRHVLFCSDQEGELALSPLIEEAKSSHASYEFRQFDHLNENQINSKLIKWLGQQKMGCFLYIAGNWEWIRKVEGMAKNIGFLNEEIQVIGLGEEKRKVMCCRCHAKEAYEDQMTLICQNCGLALTVSDHYSTRLHAYLGYPAAF